MRVALRGWIPALVAVAGLALAIGACGSGPSPAASPAVSPETPTSIPGTPAASTATPAAATSSPAGPSAPAGSPAAISSGAAATGAAVTLDKGLLAVLPATVDGVTVTTEDQSFTEALSDPAFTTNVASAVFALAVDGGDLASGVVARLRPGVYSDTWFRDWRDTYDAGACGQSGGVAGNGEGQFGGRNVYVTTCGGGLRVYHAYLEGRGVIVSLFSVGDRHLGEQLMSGLRP